MMRWVRRALIGRPLHNRELAHEKLPKWKALSIFFLGRTVFGSVWSRTDYDYVSSRAWHCCLRLHVAGGIVNFAAPGDCCFVLCPGG